MLEQLRTGGRFQFYSKFLSFSFIDLSVVLNGIDRDSEG